MFKYLRGTIDWCLHFNKFHALLKEFCDANWVYDNVEVNFTSGYVFNYLRWMAISWKSAKYTYIARSTMEAEFIAFQLASQEAEWLRGLLADMPLWGRQHMAISLHCDSQAAIGVAHNSVYNRKKRHICIRHSAVKQLLKHNITSLE